MTKMFRFCAGLMIVMMAALTGVNAQEARKPVAIKIQLVLSRYQGEKKLSSVPYMLVLTAGTEAGSRGNASVRMGVKIPVSSGGGPTATYSYQDVGTNIDCNAWEGSDAIFHVGLTVSDSSIYFQSAEQQNRLPGNSSIPAFRSFTSQFQILLRDNQTAQYTSATDQVSGEVLKIDATLNVLK